MWGIVDGPYTIASSKGGSFSTTGAVTLVPNPSYSGPKKATVTVILELPYTTDNAEFNALLGGNLDIGYAPAAGHHQADHERDDRRARTTRG